MLELQQRVRAEQFDTWFRGFKLTLCDDDTCEFVAPNGFVRDWIARNFLVDVQEAVRCATGITRSVRIVTVDANALGAHDGPTPDEVDATASTDTAADEAESPGAASPPLPVGETVGTQNGPLGGSSEPRPSEHTSTRAGPLGPQVQRFVNNIQRDIQPNAERLDPTSNAMSPHVEPSRRDSRASTVLNKHYVFEEFVVGACNRLAHAAAMAIGSNPGQAYNPFFVHGNVGLGKTHLLQAICHAILRMHPQSRVIYLSCEEFTNRFIEASQNRDLGAFRAYYRSADVLVIDDIEFLAHKSRTQIEFFHTFNTLYNSQKQIVLSSDRRAPEIPTLEDRLVSRFKWGFETSILPPCAETRASIVKRKAFLRSVPVSDEVARFIADNVTSNIRELEGAVIKVLGLAAITNQPIDTRLARDALYDNSTRRTVKVTLPDIMSLITTEFSVSTKELTGKGRTQAVSTPRQIGMFLARKHTDHSLEDVGRFFGNRDHTTVLYAVTKINKRLPQDRTFLTLIDDLSSRLMSGNRD